MRSHGRVSPLMRSSQAPIRSVQAAAGGEGQAADAQVRSARDRVDVHAHLLDGFIPGAVIDKGDLPAPAAIGVADDALAGSEGGALNRIHRPAMRALDPDRLKTPRHGLRPLSAIHATRRNRRSVARTFASDNLSAFEVSRHVRLCRVRSSELPNTDTFVRHCSNTPITKDVSLRWTSRSTSTGDSGRMARTLWSSCPSSNCDSASRSNPLHSG